MVLLFLFLLYGFWAHIDILLLDVSTMKDFLQFAPYLGFRAFVWEKIRNTFSFDETVNAYCHSDTVVILHAFEFVLHPFCQTGWRHLIWLARSQLSDPDLLPWWITQTGGPEAWQSLTSQERSVCLGKKRFFCLCVTYGVNSCSHSTCFCLLV